MATKPKYKLKSTPIEESIVEAYKRMEQSIVNSYFAIEHRVVSTYQKIEDKFVDTFLEVNENENEDEAPSNSPQGGGLRQGDNRESTVGVLSELL